MEMYNTKICLEAYTGIRPTQPSSFQ